MIEKLFISSGPFPSFGPPSPPFPPLPLVGPVGPVGPPSAVPGGNKKLFYHFTVYFHLMVNKEKSGKSAFYYYSKTDNYFMMQKE